MKEIFIMYQYTFVIQEYLYIFTLLGIRDKPFRMNTYKPSNSEKQIVNDLS